MNNSVALEYFPGGNTPDGFYSYYSYIMTHEHCKRCIILKGGPGTGKSTLMKKVAKKLIEDGYAIEYLHCSSDPDSLDAVVSRELGVWIVDGTSPHTQDPVYPGAIEEIINLGEYWDVKKITGNREEIMLAQACISEYFAQAYRYLSAAQKIAMQIDAQYRKASSPELLQPIVAELSKSYSRSDRTGKIQKAFLSAITPKGLINYIDSFCKNAEQTYLVQSDNSVLSAQLMSDLADYIKASGIDATVFYCAMEPEKKIEHIYLPEFKTFFTTSNSYHSPTDTASAQIINLDALTNTAALPVNLPSDKEAYAQLIDKAIDSIAHAKRQHDLLETFYSPAMDFSAMDGLIDTIVQKFEA